MYFSAEAVVHSVVLQPCCVDDALQLRPCPLIRLARVHKERFAAPARRSLHRHCGVDGWVLHEVDSVSMPHVAGEEPPVLGRVLLREHKLDHDVWAPPPALLGGRSGRLGHSCSFAQLVCRLIVWEDPHEGRIFVAGQVLSPEQEEGVLIDEPPQLPLHLGRHLLPQVEAEDLQAQLLMQRPASRQGRLFAVTRQQACRGGRVREQTEGDEAWQ
mmetsp:Transcript_27378/g.68324  ORF Transcript_27378/g.68324 Transcript_27378/m.68324 type:complete len:214 (+) Transcript_27378:2077-2718(+)